MVVLPLAPVVVEIQGRNPTLDFEKVAALEHQLQQDVIVLWQLPIVLLSEGLFERYCCRLRTSRY